MLLLLLLLLLMLLLLGCLLLFHARNNTGHGGRKQTTGRVTCQCGVVLPLVLVINDVVIAGCPPRLLRCELVKLRLVRMTLKDVTDGGIVLRPNRGRITPTTIVVAAQQLHTATDRFRDERDCSRD
uniref:Secreted protein n=1 Tax=Anopheles darlingi TaxID=43151 RepID=A0A2M4DQI6_ANODA